MEVGKIVMYVFLFVIGIGQFIFLQQFMMGLDMSTWTFGGHELVSSLLPIMPTIFMIILAVVPVYFLVKEAKQ